MKKQIIIGFLTGVIANATGVGMCIVIISFLKETSISEKDIKLPVLEEKK